jgi:O-acetyl-ADP-ribose deacetylase (regulator of RNase III)
LNDITQEYGTIVNAANTDLDHIGGVAAAISDKGGYIIN